MGSRGPKKGTKYKKPIKLNAGNKLIGKRPEFSQKIESIPVLEEKPLHEEKLSPSEQFNPDIIFDQPKEEKQEPEEKKPSISLEDEARFVLSGAFEGVALLTSIPEMALTIEEKLGATPSFVPIYVEYIKPMLGSKPELVVFTFVMLEIVGKRFPLIVKKYGKKNTPPESQENR